MQNFTFENPTKIIFGKGMIARIGGEAARFGTKALIVYGSGSIKANGVYDQVVTSLNEARRPFAEYCGVKSNPVLSHTLKGIDAACSEWYWSSIFVELFLKGSWRQKAQSLLFPLSIIEQLDIF